MKARERREPEGKSRESRLVEHPHKTVVVVGVDGSESSSLALAWAAEEARLRRATLRVVSAWSFPSYGLSYTALSAEVFEDSAKIATRALERQIAEVLGGAIALRLETVLEYGQPTQVILDSSKDAELIVVGSRGRGGFGGLILGSTSQQVLHHAHCPVTVVHGKSDLVENC